MLQAAGQVNSCSDFIQKDELQLSSQSCQNSSVYHRSEIPWRVSAAESNPCSCLQPPCQHITGFHKELESVVFLVN
ncbi:unnamed protein product, partial [Allacma fusca]